MADASQIINRLGDHVGALTVQLFIAQAENAELKNELALLHEQHKDEEPDEG